MWPPFFQGFFYGAALIALAFASWEDIRSRQVSGFHWKLIAVIGLFGPATTADIGSRLLASGAFLVFGYAMWALKSMGGGDAKLLAALALGMSPSVVPMFVIRLTLMAGLYMVLCSAQSGSTVWKVRPPLVPVILMALLLSVVPSLL